MSKPQKKIQYLELDVLRLDHDNPRLPSRIEGANEQETIDYLVKEEKTLELMVSIGESGYFEGEPLLVTASKVDKGKYIVVEGNRRLTALTLLNYPDKTNIKKRTVATYAENAHEKPNEVPCVVFQTREDILEYLGYRHVTGVAAWDALAKARYVRQLFDKMETDLPDDKKCTQLARKIGSRSDYVKKLLCGYSLYTVIEDNDFFDIENGEKEISFSLLTTALGYRKIVDFLELESPGDITAAEEVNQKHLRDITTWLFKKEEGVTRLGESRNLRKLADVVAEEKSLKEFRAGVPLEDCFFLSGGNAAMVSEAITASYNKLQFAKRYIDVDTDLDETTIDIITSIIKTAKTIKRIVESDDE